MKRLLIGLTLVALSTSAMAQDAADKKYQAGLVAGFGINFQEMGTTRMESMGLGTDFTLGANVNIGLTETIGFTTGAEFDFERLRFRNGANPVYYHYLDKKIIQEEDLASTNNAQLFQLIERRQSAVYLTVPTMMMFRTKFIGYFRYFGKFGLRNSILLSSNSDDTGVDFDPENIVTGAQTSVTLENMEAPGEMVFFKSAVGGGGGAEWNFVGSTSLVAELAFYYGFTPLFFDRADSNKATLFTSGINNGQGNDLYFSNQARQSQLMLKVSILF